MASLQKSGPETHATTPNKKHGKIQAAGVRKPNNELLIQAQLAYPSPEQNPPARSLAFRTSAEIYEQAQTPATPVSGTSYQNEDFALFGDGPSGYEIYGNDDISTKVQRGGSIPSYDSTEDPGEETAPSAPYDPALDTLCLSTHHHIHHSVYTTDLLLPSNYSHTNAEKDILSPFAMWKDGFAYRVKQKK